MKDLPEFRIPFGEFQTIVNGSSSVSGLPVQKTSKLSMKCSPQSAMPCHLTLSLAVSGPMSLFYLIRHAETDWNRARRLQGHSDIPLNSTGNQQALGLVRLLDRIQPDLIYTSDLLRAKQTALIANQKLQRPLIKSRSLREVYLGQAEGMSREDVPLKFGQELWDRWGSNLVRDFDVQFPEAESRTEALQRFKNFIVLELTKSPDKTLVFFTHGLILRTFSIFHNPDRGLELLIPNCSCLEFRWANHHPVLLRQIDRLEQFDQKES